MSGDINSLLALHRLAQRYGDGLKPELLRVLQPETPQGAIPLDMPLRSSGPSEHNLSQQELESLGISRVGSQAQQDGEKDGTYD